MRQEWVNPHIAFAELISDYNDELNDYIIDLGDDYNPKDAKKYIIDFFDTKDLGREVRRLIRQMKV